MRVCLMAEGQEDVTWPQWVALAEACEAAGLEGLFRSDHYLSVMGRFERGALDAWTTLAALAAVTTRIRLGTLVSPATFRHPSLLAKVVVTADHVSAGRVELGMGAGWFEREHAAYGFPFEPTAQRIDELEEQIAIVHQLWNDDAVEFHGQRHRLEGVAALPRPYQDPHPNLIVGGVAGPRSAALAARWADEYNTIFATPDECRRRRAAVERACEQRGRDPSTLTFSLMTGVVVAEDRAQLRARAAATMEVTSQTGDPDAWLDGQPRNGWIVGTVDEVTTQLGDLETAGVERVMLQHLPVDDLDTVQLLGERVAPALAPGVVR